MDASVRDDGALGTPPREAARWPRPRRASPTTVSALDSPGSRPRRLCGRPEVTLARLAVEPAQALGGRRSQSALSLGPLRAAAGLRPLPAPPAGERLPALAPGAETQLGTRGCSDTELPRDVAGGVAEEEAAAAERPRGPWREKPDPGSGGRRGRARLCSHVSCKPPASLCAWSVTRPRLRADPPLSPR